MGIGGCESGVGLHLPLLYASIWKVVMANRKGRESKELKKAQTAPAIQTAIRRGATGIDPGVIRTSTMPWRAHEQRSRDRGKDGDVPK